MLVDEIGTLFQGLTQEDDPTFITPAITSVILGLGYGQFRTIVSTHDPDFYGIRVTIVPAADNYNLSTAAVRILGGGALTGPRLVKLLKVVNVDGAGTVSFFYRAAGSTEELHRKSSRYLLEGSLLHFTNDSVSGESIELRYVPVSSVDWTRLTAGDAEFVDDLEEFHDIIAMLGVRQYSVRDGVGNDVLDGLLQQRLHELEMYLTSGRVPESGDHILDEGRR
jgi:hypothetical protein